MSINNAFTDPAVIKKPVLCLAALCIFSVLVSNGLQADDEDIGGKALRAASSISEVILYKDRAAVERTVEIDLPDGYSEVVFPALPDRILDDTVRIKSTRGENLTFLGIEVEKKYLVKSRQKRIRDLESRIEDLRRDDATLVDRMNAARTAIRFIESISDFASRKAHEGLLYKGVNLNEMSETMGFVERGMLKEQEKIRKITENRKDLSDKIRVLEKKLTDIAGSRYMSFRGNVIATQSNMLNQNQPQSINQYTGDAAEMDRETTVRKAEDREKWARLSLRAKRAGKYTLKLTYVITGAQWRPLYDIRADLNDKKIDLTYYAMVKQSTGEDWNNVRLYLSTADPRKAADPPGLNPWTVDIRPRVPASISKSRRIGGAMASVMDEMPASAPAREELYSEESVIETVQTRGISVTYAVAARKTIPSDNQSHKTPIDTIPFSAKNAEFIYAVIPERSANAYLKTEISNASKFTLFPGNANLYLDGDYVGNTGISKTVTPDKNFDLHFGVDEGLRAEKTLVNKFSEEKGLFSGDNRINYHYQIKLENNKKKEETFLVSDRLPVSRNDAVKVEMVSISPAFLADEEEKKKVEYIQGIRRWRITVPAMSSRVVDIKFFIQHQKDDSVSGLQ